MGSRHALPRSASTFAQCRENASYMSAETSARPCSPNCARSSPSSSTFLDVVEPSAVPATPLVRRDGTERAWTEHLATNVGARVLLAAVRRAELPHHIAATLDEVIVALIAETTVDEFGAAQPRPTHRVIHQLHLAGKYPDVAINDRRDRMFAVIEVQRGPADDRHIAKLAANYVPRSGAQFGILVAEGWRRSSASHPAWAACTAPVAVVVARDTPPEPDYQVAWVHHPVGADCDYD